MNTRYSPSILATTIKNLMRPPAVDVIVDDLTGLLATMLQRLVRVRRPNTIPIHLLDAQVQIVNVAEKIILDKEDCTLVVVAYIPKQEQFVLISAQASIEPICEQLCVVDECAPVEELLELFRDFTVCECAQALVCTIYLIESGQL